MRVALGLQAIPSVMLFLFAAFISAQNADYVQGLNAYREQQYAKAVPLFAAAERESHGATDAQLYEGKALAYLARLPQSESVLFSYLQSHPTSFDALEVLATVQQRENKPAASLATFTRAARLHTPSSADLTSAALDYVLLNDYADAIHWLQMALKFDPDNGPAWYDLGRCDYTQSHFSEAQKAFERAGTLMPEDLRVPENLGLTFEAENMVPMAEQQYRKAVGLARSSRQSDEWPYLDYGVFLLTHDRGAEAIPQLQDAVNANPKCAACHEMLGRALASTGKVTEGVGQLEQAVALSPDDPRMHYELGRLYHQAGDDVKAKTQFALSATMYKSKAQSNSTP